MWLYLPRRQYDSRPQQPVKLLYKTRTDTWKIWIIPIGPKNCSSQPNSFSAPVGGSLFSPTAISIIHKTSQHLFSEDGQSLAPFNIMRCIAVFQPQPSQLAQDCVNQPLSAVAWGGNVAPPPSSAYRFTGIPDAEQEKKQGSKLVSHL